MAYVPQSTSQFNQHDGGGFPGGQNTQYSNNFPSNNAPQYPPTQFPSSAQQNGVQSNYPQANQNGHGPVPNLTGPQYPPAPNNFGNPTSNMPGSQQTPNNVSKPGFSQVPQGLPPSSASMPGPPKMPGFSSGPPSQGFGNQPLQGSNQQPFGQQPASANPGNQYPPNAQTYPGGPSVSAAPAPTMGMPPSQNNGPPKPAFNQPGPPNMAFPGSTPAPQNMGVQGGMPSMGGPQHMGAPPNMAGPGGPPNMSGPGGPPNMSGPGGPPNMSGPGGPPNMSGPGGPLNMSGPGGPPNMSGPGGPPNMLGPGGPPNMAGPGGPPNMSGPGGPPNMLGPGGPPNMAGPGGPQFGQPPSFGAQPFPSMPGAPGQGQFNNQPGMNNFPGQMGGAPGQPMPPGAYPPGQQRQRLDPNMMPSAVAVMEDDAVRAGLFPTGYPNAEPPPLVSTNFYAQDQGNCNPRFMRSTLYVAPASQDILKSSQVPFAVACSPFAKLHENEVQPPLIDLGPGGPVRCQRCKAYMCPFMEFQDGGRRFRCPFCNSSTPVEDVYFAHLDHTGRRTDIEHRPELYLGAYEFLATKQYCKNGLQPKEPAFIFMIDVSYNSIQNGMVHVLCTSLLRVLNSLAKDSNQSESTIRVGLATFDHAVHFYDLSSKKPSMLVVGDVTEMFVPIVDGLFLPLSEAVPAITAVLAEIPKLFSGNKITETMLGPVVNAGMDALKCADRSGKLFVFTSNLPTFEAPGKLQTKNDRALLGTDKEKSALTPQTDYYTKVGEECVKAGVTVDLFLFPNAFIDLATISQLTAVTGGSIFKYQYFTPDKDAHRFLSDLQHDVSRQIGFDCMVRIRSSAGIRPITFSGSFYMENSTDLEIASIDEDKSFFAELKHDDKLTDPHAVIQCAVLYTSCGGQRRLRILNLCLPVSADFNHFYRVADQDTLATYLFKTAVLMNKEKGNKETRDSLAQRSAQILATYREKCSENAPLGQLILPETLKLLPLFVCSILKNDSVSGGSDLTVDDKVWMIELIRSIGISDAMRLLYPKVIPVSDLECQDPSELMSLAGATRASTEFLTNEKAYLIDNGIVMFLWIGLGVAEAWVRDVFGVQAITQIDTESNKIPEKDNGKSRGLRRAVQLMEAEGKRTRKLFIIRERDALEPWMKKFLVEDKASPTSMSYVDFLCHVHREIRSILS